MSISDDALLLAPQNNSCFETHDHDDPKPCDRREGNENLPNLFAQYDYLESINDDTITQYEALLRRAQNLQALYSIRPDAPVPPLDWELNLSHRTHMPLTRTAPFGSPLRTAEPSGTNVITEKQARSVPLLKEVTLCIAKADALELEIQLYRYRMRNIELEILDAVPRTIEEAAMKLGFISFLMKSGEPIDVDYFGEVTAECAQSVLHLRHLV